MNQTTKVLQVKHCRLCGGEGHYAPTCGQPRLDRPAHRIGGRQRFQCEVCGLELEGRLNSARTAIVAYDRAPYDGSPVQAFRCVDSPLCVAEDK